MYTSFTVANPHALFQAGLFMMDSTNSEKVLPQLDTLATIARAGSSIPQEIRICAIAKFFKIIEHTELDRE
jgi:hypothetical protein